MGAKEPRAAESALKLKALVEFPWSKVPTYNLAHNPACNPACNPAEGGCNRVAVI